MTPQRIVIAGGGTGGPPVSRESRWHESLRRSVPGATVTFAGTARGIESRVVPREGFELDVLRSAGLKGMSLVVAGARPVAAAAERRSTRGRSSRAGGRSS